MPQDDELMALRGPFLSGASHDLRTPLASVRTTLHALLQGARDVGDVELADLVARADGQLLRLARLIDKVLDFDLLTAGQLELEARSLDYGALARAVVGELRAAFFARAIEGHAVEGARVRGDRDRLRSTLFLLGSALLREGEPRAALRVDVEVAGAVVRTRLTSPGASVPAELFEPEAGRRLALSEDQQALHWRALVVRLALARRILALHGGAVVGVAAPSGAVVELSLPLAPA